MNRLMGECVNGWVGEWVYGVDGSVSQCAKSNDLDDVQKSSSMFTVLIEHFYRARILDRDTHLKQECQSNPILHEWGCHWGTRQRGTGNGFAVPAWWSWIHGVEIHRNPRLFRMAGSQAERQKRTTETERMQKTGRGGKEQKGDSRKGASERSLFERKGQERAGKKE